MISMIHLSVPVIIEFFIGLIFWWLAIYLFTQNPFTRIIQILFGIFISASFYFSSDILFQAALETHQYHFLVSSLKSVVWAIYLPIALIYHASYLLTPEKERKNWQKILLYLSYISAGIMIFLETFTNLTRNYSIINSPIFSGNIDGLTGKYFWLLGVFFIPLFIATAINLFLQFRKQLKFSPSWYKFFWPLLGIISSVLIGPIVLLSYYGIIPHPYFLADIIFGVISITLMYSIIKYNFFIDEIKIVFGKNFLFSTLGMVIILALYILVIFLSKIQFLTPDSLVLPYILILLIITSHPAYLWLNTFTHDLTYNVSSGLSVVNDEEIYQALKNYNNPDILENSALLRLNLISNTLSKDNSKTPVDILKNVINESIDYFEPSIDINRRTKQNLKYHLLKMMAFDQAEEGQMLWELGFDEYPVRIMTQESGSSPLFQTKSPSDYSYVSRNAFLALKKEAIHDVTWRISYLEKLEKKKN